MAKKRNEVAKEKVVEFKLDKEMKISDMINKGYRRKEVITLFEHLEELKLGEYIRGTRGASNPTKFIANERCPDSFSITFKVFRFRKNSQEQIQEQESCCKVVENFDNIAKVIASHSKKLKIEPFPTDSSGYMVGTSDDKAFIVRSSECGFKTIEQAVKSCWHIFEGKVSLFKSRNMKDFEQVASMLRGVGYVELKGE